MSKQIRRPQFPCNVEFDKRASGFGSAEKTVSMTEFEAKLAVRHWLAMRWAVETTWDSGTSGSWETSMFQYANYRISTLKEAGLVTQEDIDYIGDQWDWPPFEDSGEEVIEADHHGPFYDSPHDV